MLGTAIMELSEEIVGAPVILIWIRDRQSFFSWKLVFHITNLIIWRNQLIYFNMQEKKKKRIPVMILK